MSAPAHAHAHAHPHAHPSPTSDLLGQFISVLCVVHCMATPVLLTLAPAALGVVGGEHWHPVLLVFVIGTAAWAFVPGYRYHRKIEVPLLATGGLIFLALGALVFEGQLLVETALSVCGATLMLVAHWRNRAHNRVCKH